MYEKRVCYKKSDEYYILDLQGRTEYEFVSDDTSNCKPEVINNAPKTDKFSNLLIISLAFLGVGGGIVYYIKRKKLS